MLCPSVESPFFGSEFFLFLDVLDWTSCTVSLS